MKELINLLMSNLILVLTVIGLLAFIVSIITEVTKGLGFLKRIPTDLQVIVLSIILCIFAYFGYISYFVLAIRWYFLVGCIVAAFIVAFVAMYGWNKLSILYLRFKYPIEKEANIDEDK